jgi:hypothetical protein
MAIPQDDRIAFSLKIVSADQEAAGLDSAKATLQAEVAKIQKLDTANKNLFDPVNTLINGYHSELQKINGIPRFALTEQQILDSAGRKMRNSFFPNDTSITVPSLSSLNNVWSQVKPFALTVAIGKSYTENYDSPVTKEQDLINSCLTLITSASAYVDIELTSGQTCGATGSCSNPAYTTQPTCISGGGIWTPGLDAIITYTDVQTLKTNLVNAINTLFTFLTGEASSIVTNDPDAGHQSQNATAISNINSTLKPLLTTWLGYPDFQTVPLSVTTCVAFYAYNPSLLAPTKLHSTELTALQTALNNRLTFLTTRVSQVTSNLGSITQNVSTGELTSSVGLYGKRYGLVLLRLNAFGGSLTSLSGLQTAVNAQDGIKSNVLATKATYYGILPTSSFKANANGSEIVHLNDVTFLSPGDTVYVVAEGQEELKRAVKSISGAVVTLNDIVPSKYRTSERARLYKDLT